MLRDEQGDRAKQLQYPADPGRGPHAGSGSGAASAGLPFCPTTRCEPPRWRPLRTTTIQPSPGRCSRPMAASPMTSCPPRRTCWSTRRGWAIEFLEADRCERSSILAPCLVKSLRSSHSSDDPRIKELITRHFGPIKPSTSAELQSQITRLARHRSVWRRGFPSRASRSSSTSALAATSSSARGATSAPT